MVHGDGEDSAHIKDYWAKKYVAVAQGIYLSNGKIAQAFAWLRNAAFENDGIWTATEEVTMETLDNARTRKVRPLNSSGVILNEEPRLSVILVEDENTAWLRSTHLPFGECKAWVEKNKAPTMFTGAHVENNQVTATRPICLYPAEARYKGSGDSKDAANFICAAPGMKGS